MREEQSIPPMLLARLVALGEGRYQSICVRAGAICAVERFITTWGLLVGMTVDSPYQRRYCYANRNDALDALKAWDGRGDPGGPWIKVKGVSPEGRPLDDLGPGALA